MPHRMADAAMREVASIWAAYDVDVRASRPGVAGGDDAITLVVVLATHRDERISVEALGSIEFLDGVPKPIIELYPNTITALMSQAALSAYTEPARWAVLGDLVLGRVLGRALAHEIGHFLLRSRQHSASGLMRARPPLSTLVATDRGHSFVLSSDSIPRRPQEGIAKLQD